MFKKITRKKLEIFLMQHASQVKTLDVGSGGSAYDVFFPNRITIDIDEKRRPDIVADAEQMPFDDDTFELILCTEVLEHVKNPETVLSECLRVLAPGGKIILTTRFIYPLHDTPNDYWRFTKYGLAHLFRSWEKVKVQAETENFETFAVLFQRMAFQATLRINRLTKLLLFLLSSTLPLGNFLIKKEYGDIKKSVEEKGIFVSGYYVTARKSNIQ